MATYTADKKGFYRKFRIYRSDNNEYVDEDTFTVVPDRDPHGKVAVLAYADSIENENPGLAANLRDRFGHV